MSKIKVLQLENLDEIIVFEKQMMEKKIPDLVEREFASWDSKARKEALEHYLSLGWSFGVFDKEVLKGYFLAQTLVFFNGQTQTLWVEHLSSVDPSYANELVEVAYKMSREKHLQKVIFNDYADYEVVMAGYKTSEFSLQAKEMKTTKSL